MHHQNAIECSKCHSVLPHDHFAPARRQCKACISAYQKEYRIKNNNKLVEYSKIYYKEHSERIQKRTNNYYWDNLERERLARKKWTEENKEKVFIQQKKWRERNRDHCNLVRKEYYKNNLSAHIGAHIRKTIHSKVKKSNGKKDGSSVEILGCSIDDLKRHIESLWVTGMSWENYGAWRKGRPMTWHIDHIKPCASFDLTDPEQQRICFHYTNLQPLWAIDNIKKGDKV